MSDVLDDNEYERRFLVEDLSVLRGVEDYDEIDQAYLWAEGGYAVRVRGIWDKDADSEQAQAFLTLKGPRANASRYEVEVPIALDHARQLVALAPQSVRKKRYGIISEGNPWVVDVFEGSNKGLVIAEFEASRTAVENLKKPWWAGEEVTEDPRFNNEALAANPWPFDDAQGGES